MKKGLSIVSILIVICLCPSLSLLAQQQSSNSSLQEVYLSFRHRGTVDQMVASFYDGQQQTFYLPITGLFSALGIEYEVNQDALTVEGSFIDTGSRYTLDFQQQYINFKDRRIELSADDYLIKELDFFIKPALLAKLLDLRFKVNFSSLSLSLESDYTMPVVAEMQRKRRRKREMEEMTVRQDDYPLRYRREQSVVDGAFFDYNLSSNITNELNLYTFNGNMGAELLAGDIQGTMTGSISRADTTFITDNLRWRYVLRENDWISRIRVGQSVTEGIQSRSFTGVKVSNEPIEPRISFDEYVVQGEAQPQSEVELYMNNNLIDYQEADELGNYRFVIPLTYGSSRLRIRIYGQDGSVQEYNRRILVPFNFQKPGEFRYTFSAGRMDRRVFGTSERGYLMQSEARMGLNRNLTVGGGFEYMEPVHTQRPLFYGTLSSRIFTNYLVNADIAPDAFYRLRTNTVYASSAGWGLDYTYYPENNFYNRSGNDHEVSGNFFVPFSIGPLQFNTRLFGTHRRGPGPPSTRYRLDLNTRISRVTIRTGFSDRQLGSLEAATTPAARLTTSFSYSLPRGESVPSFVEGTYLRGQVDYSPYSKELQRANIQLSRNISQTGRFRVSLDRSFTGGYNSINAGITFNFSKVRTNSTVRTNRGNTSYTQNLRGTIGYDSHNSDVVFDNRQQVGRSAASVRLFLDENNNSTFDEGEKVIKDNAVQLRRSGDIEMSKDGTIHMMQLQAYNRLNAHINKSAITNPLYIPEVEEFSFIADPNQFKPINIPFYQSGVISGNVYRMRTDTSDKEPVAGLRLKLSGMDDDFSKEMRTFSDGGFYTMEIPPGKYHLQVDSTQLDFLDVNSNPETRTFRVEAKSQGDFVEGLHFILRPRKDTTAKEMASAADSVNSNTTTQSTTDTVKVSQPASETDLAGSKKAHYYIQMASYKRPDSAIALAQWMHLNTSFKDLYLVRSNNYFSLLGVPGSSLPEALEKLINIRKNYLGDAFLVKNHAPNIKSLAYSVQLGAYESRELAENLVQSIEKSLERPLNISRSGDFFGDTDPTNFTVHTQPTKSWDRALSLRDRMRTLPFISTAVLNYHIPDREIDPLYGQVFRVGPFTRKSDADAILEIMDEGLSAGVIEGRSDDKFFILLESADNVMRLAKIKKVLGDDYPGVTIESFLLKSYGGGED